MVLFERGGKCCFETTLNRIRLRSATTLIYFSTSVIPLLHGDF